MCAKILSLKLNIGIFIYHHSSNVIFHPNPFERAKNERLDGKTDSAVTHYSTVELDIDTDLFSFSEGWRMTLTFRKKLQSKEK
jgi:hypothetical protein